MKTYFNVGKIYTINSHCPSWAARTLGENKNIQIPRGTAVVLLKESKGIDANQIAVVVLMPNGTICCTTVGTTELHKWILTTQ